MIAETVRENRSKLFDRASNLQKATAIASLVTALIALFLIVAWMNGSDTAAKYLGGLDFKELIFNYHPIFMTLGMLCCGLSAIFTYRVLDLPKPVTKLLHGFLHLCTIVFIIVGLYCVFKGNDDKDYNTGHVYYANLFTIHSFIGLAAVLVYCSNYLLGFVYFLTSLLPDKSRAWFVPNHSFIGLVSLVLVFLAIETGIMDLTRELGCDISVDSADLNPAENYHKLQEGCRVGNAAGILVLLTLVLALYALFDFRTKRDDKEENFNYLLDNQRA